MTKKRSQRIRCCKCKQTTGFISPEYEINVDITCPECFTGKKKKKKKTISTATGRYAGIKKGIREDVHPTYSFRSPTETNFARVLNLLGVTWTYEERSFTFEGYKTKPHVYVMDFVIEKVDHRHNVPEWLSEGFVEVKGYMDSQSRQRLRRLRKQYPEEADKTLVLLYSHYNKKDIRFCEALGYKYYFYDYLTKDFSDKIKEWEGKK